MDFASSALTVLIGCLVAAAGYAYWRWVWFWRNPDRVPPPGAGILSPADGTVVYVRAIPPGGDVISIKEGLAAKLPDITHADSDAPMLLVGIFMSPFNVHVNRAPVAGTVNFIKHYPGADARNVHMGPMHWRLLLRRPPYYRNATHIVRNERTVTRFDTVRNHVPTPCYVVQIAARTVAGIASYVNPGQFIAKGEVFGMIRVGSQVDVALPWTADMKVLVQAGDKVRAGETILVE